MIVFGSPYRQSLLLAATHLLVKRLGLDKAIDERLDLLEFPSIRWVGVARTIADTKTTAVGGMGPRKYWLAGQGVIVGDNGVAWAADRCHFVGSTASRRFIREVLQKTFGLTAEEVDRLTAVNPSRAIFDTGFV